MIDLLIYIGVGAVVVGVPLVYFARYRRHLKETRQKQEASQTAGLTEPVSLHPMIDPNLCICSAGCTAACPEGGIIGILGGTAELVTPTKCIGHGACADACPVGAISLVFGTERRGFDIPHLSPTFETNVPGIYIAGELGGMGLIRNAVTQGRQAVEFLSSDLNGKGSDIHDLIIVGAGPAGFSAALQARKQGLDAVILEQGGGVGGTILSYPRQKLVMTQPMILPLFGKVNQRHFIKEDLVSMWERIAREQGIVVRGGQKVEAVDGNKDAFVVRTTGGEYRARRVLLAIGRRGTPRRLGVPGEEGSKVTYRLLEPEQYRDRQLLVVGGGDSAVEAAVALSNQPGSSVALSYRRDVFGRIKEENRARLDEAVSSLALVPYLQSEVRRVDSHAVVLEHNGQELELANDYVFVFAGGELPTAFLQGVGIQMQKKFGER